MFLTYLVKVMSQNIIFNLLTNIQISLRMPGKTGMERVKQNALLAKQTIKELKNELNVVSKEYNAMLAKQLQEENAKLLLAVDNAKKKLIQLETQQGIQQIAVPNQTVSISVTDTETKLINTEPTAQYKPKKEKKDKEHKVVQELPIDIRRLDLRIGKVVDIKRHPDADSLFVLQINVGEDKLRTVCSGLVKYILMEDLRDKTIVALCNLKPVKMRGITSEAMVMCASSESTVETLIPPENSLPGDLVHCEGYARQPDHPVMNPKKKIFETVAPDLQTNDNLEACYKGVPFQVAGKGVCRSKTLKNVPVK